MEKPTYDLWLVGAAGLLIDHDIPASQRQAVLDCMLYAQLLADKRHGSRFNDFAAWHATFHEALQGRGWITTVQNQACNLHLHETLLAPLQMAQAWLETRLAQAPQLLEIANQALARKAEVEHFTALTQVEHAHSTQAVYQFGLVLPGPVIELSSLAFAASLPAEELDPATLVSGAQLQGDMRIRNLSALLDGDLFELQRQALRDLIAGKQRQHDYIRNLGPLTLGDNHG